jgi:hypothetical protein
VLQTQLQNLVYGETEFTTLGNVFEKIKTVYGRPNQVSHSQLQFIYLTATLGIILTRYSDVSMEYDLFAIELTAL